MTKKQLIKAIQNAIDNKVIRLIGGGIPVGSHPGRFADIEDIDESVQTSRNDKNFKYLRLPLILTIGKKDVERSIPLSEDLFNEVKSLSGEEFILKVEKPEGAQYANYTFLATKD